MAKILIIDDEHNIRMMVRLALQHDGHEVTVAADGDEGLQKFGDGSEWDLVLLDQRMPGMEGVEVLRHIKEREPSARVIMITAFGTVDLAVAVMKTGATDFVRKPFTTEILRGAVQAALTEPEPEQGIDASLLPVTFSMTTLNGFRIAFVAGSGLTVNDEMGFPFTVRHPGGEERRCTITLANHVREEINYYLGSVVTPPSSRFWQAICEEALANHLYQNASFPPDNFLHLDEFTLGLRRFVDAISQVK